MHGFFSLSDQNRYLNLNRNWKKFPRPAARFENGNLNFSCHQRPFYFPYVPPSSLFSHVIPDLLLQGGAAFCNISASCIHTLTAKWLKVLAIVGKCGTHWPFSLGAKSKKNIVIARVLFYCSIPSLRTLFSLRGDYLMESKKKLQKVAESLFGRPLPSVPCGSCKYSTPQRGRTKLRENGNFRECPIFSSFLGP